MIEYFLGIITGLLFSILVAVMLVYFKNPIMKYTNIIEKQIANKGPIPKGFIFDPPDEADEFRQNIINENDKAGRDTKISDLL